MNYYVKHKLLLIISIVITTLLIISSTSVKAYIMGYKYKNGNDISEVIDSTNTVELDESNNQIQITNTIEVQEPNKPVEKILDEGHLHQENLPKLEKFYTITKMPASYEGLNPMLQYDYKLILFDNCGDVIHEKIFPIKAPLVRAISDTILEIQLSVGNPGPKYNYYYNTKENLISDEFSCAVLCEDKLIIYYIDVSEDNDASKLIIRDIFDKDIFYKEIERDFKEMSFNPTNAIVSLDIIDNESAVLEYYTENGAWEKVVEIIDLSQ